jgi:L-threonylcarbamoyladenylate synthase
MARALWPQPLTIRVKPQRKLPSKVLKQLGGAKSKIGVRVPADPLMREIVSRAGRPLLASSANRERKTGDHSPAQVRRNFGATVDLFVDRGDLQPGPLSTVIDVKKGQLVVERAGAISEDTLRKLAAG